MDAAESKFWPYVQDEDLSLMIQAFGDGIESVKATKAP